MEKLNRELVPHLQNGIQKFERSPDISGLSKKDIQERDCKRINRKARAKLNNEDYWWYCLNVATGKEMLVQKLLAKGKTAIDPGNQNSALPGEAAFLVPLIVRKHRTNRYSRQKKSVCYPAIPGALLLGLNTHCDELHYFLRLQFIRGVLNIGGRPAILGGKAIATFINSVEANFDTNSCRIADNAPRKPEVGDEVKIAAGPFRGHDAMVSQIDETQASVLLELFGATREVSIYSDALELKMMPQTHSVH